MKHPHPFRHTPEAKLREKRALARNPENSPPPEESPQTEGETDTNDLLQAGATKAAQRKERREARAERERWSRSLEAATSSEVYRISKGLTDVLLLYQRINERKRERGEQVDKQRLQDVAKLEQRLRIARDVRADENGWARETSEVLRDRLQEERTELRKLDAQFESVQTQANLSESVRDHRYRDLPAGITLSDILRLIQDKRFATIDNIGTIEQVLEARGER